MTAPRWVENTGGSPSLYLFSSFFFFFLAASFPVLPPFPDSQHLLDPLTCCIVTWVSSMEAVCEERAREVPQCGRREEKHRISEHIYIYIKKKQMRLSYFKPTVVIQVRGGGK